MTPRPGRTPAIATTLLLLAALLAALAWEARSGYEITRVRNALIARVGQPEDFNWTPDHPPPGFRLEHGTVPPPMRQAMDALFQAPSNPPNADENWHRSLRLARYLASGPGTGEGVLGDTLEAWDNILHGKNAYCADFTQVFNGLAYAIDVPVREWGMSFDGYSGWGHAFSEIWDQGQQRWIFLDTFNSLYVTDKASGKALSVDEFAGYLARGQQAAVQVQIIEPRRFGFRDKQQALDYYARGLGQRFLWWGNDVFSYDANPWVHGAGRLSRALEQLTAIALGIYPDMVLVAEPGNRSAINSLLQKRQIILGLGLAIALLSLLLLAQLVLARRHRQRKPRPLFHS